MPRSRDLLRSILSVALAAGLAAGMATGAEARAQASDRAEPRRYAPLHRPGPPLSVPVRKLRAALDCSRDVSLGRRTPVILVHGTQLNPKANFSWNYVPAFRDDRRPYCTVALPESGMEDIQVAGEYVVYSLREVARISGGRVDVVGYSQGGMVPRWVLRFWPDTRELVDDLVGLAPSNHGTPTPIPFCQQSCAPAYWQQRLDAKFIAALNSRAETFAGIDYSVIYSRTDEIVTPNFDGTASSLRTGEGKVVNIAIQDVCPNDSSEHLAIGSYDATAYALAVDALDHAGPAAARRVPISTCADPFMPGVDRGSFPRDFAGYLQTIGEEGDYPGVPTEPPLKEYVFDK